MSGSSSQSTPTDAGAQRRKVICVLGMHRSGTSALTGTLQEAGVFLGEVRQRSSLNAKGNRENRRIRLLHDAILTASGGSWDMPPACVVWGPEHRAERDAIVAGFADEPCWGFKDPRTIFTLEGWEEVLPDLQPIGIFRDPALVATSLFRRNGFALTRAVSLWLQYNRRLLEHHGRRPFPIVPFHEHATRQRELFGAVVSGLGLSNASEGLQFFDAALRTSSPADIDLPAEVISTYDRLREIARASFP